jgi:hypothetical protein
MPWSGSPAKVLEVVQVRRQVELLERQVLELVDEDGS